MQCHPERSDCFATRSGRGVEGPPISVGRGVLTKVLRLKFPATNVRDSGYPRGPSTVWSFALRTITSLRMTF